MSVTAWFGEALSADKRENAFIRTVAAAASGWAFADLSPDDTSTRWAYPNGSGLLAEVRVPALTTSRVRLRVLYEPGISGLPVLQSEWSSIEYSFDRPGAQPPDGDVELWVTGVEASPEQCGMWAARWFERQLRRPVVRREWDRPMSGVSSLVPGTSSGPVAVEWTVGEPDRILDSRGGLRWWWLTRQPPSREVVERN